MAVSLGFGIALAIHSLGLTVFQWSSVDAVGIPSVQYSVVLVFLSPYLAFCAENTS